MNAYTQTDFKYVASAQSIFTGDTNQPKTSFDQLIKLDVTPFSFDQLPNKVISLIIHQLSQDKKTLYQCALINKRLNTITNPILWQDPFYDIKPENDDFAERLLNCVSDAQPTLGQHIRKLKVTSKFWNDIHLALFITQVRHLEHIYIEGSEAYNDNNNNNITGSGLYLFPDYCPDLISLCFSCIDIPEYLFLSLGQCCEKLHHLNFNDCKFESPPPLPNDFELELEAAEWGVEEDWAAEWGAQADWGVAEVDWRVDTNQEEATSNGEVPATNDDLELTNNNDDALATNDEALATNNDLEVSSDRQTSHNEQIENLPSNEETEPVIVYFQKLTSLTIMAESGAAIPILLSMATTPWHSLIQLELNCCYDMDDTTFIPFIKSLPSLQTLFLSGANFTDAGLDAMSECLPSLLKVDLSYHSNISPDGARRWIQHGLELVSVKLYHCDMILSSHFPELSLNANGNDSDDIDLDQVTIDKVRATMNK